MEFEKKKRTRDKLFEGFGAIYILITVLLLIVGIVMLMFENSDGASPFFIGLVMSFFSGIFMD